jgi:hypothetical protein
MFVGNFTDEQSCVNIFLISRQLLNAGSMSVLYFLIMTSRSTSVTVDDATLFPQQLKYMLLALLREGGRVAAVEDKTLLNEYLQ